MAFKVFFKVLKYISNGAFKGVYFVNMALSRSATQSSTDGLHEANNAVDGAISTWAVIDYYDLQPWWKVHLAYPIWVSHVEIKCSPCE